MFHLKQKKKNIQLLDQIIRMEMEPKPISLALMHNPWFGESQTMYHVQPHTSASGDVWGWTVVEGLQFGPKDLDTLP